MQPLTLVDWRVELVNRLANQPGNIALTQHCYPRPFSAIDLTPVVLDPSVIVLGDSRGVAIFEPSPFSPTAAEGHYLMAVTTPGDVKLRLARQFVNTLFTSYPYDTIVGNVPVAHRAARMFTRALGFAPVGRSVGPLGCPCVEYRLTRTT